MDKKRKQHRQKGPTADELEDVASPASASPSEGPAPAPPGASFNTEQGRAAQGMRKDIGKGGGDTVQPSPEDQQEMQRRALHESARADAAGRAGDGGDGGAGASASAGPADSEGSEIEGAMGGASDGSSGGDSSGPGGHARGKGKGAGAGIPGGGTDIRTAGRFNQGDVEQDRAKIFPDSGR
jgi:hypothetical protein